MASEVDICNLGLAHLGDEAGVVAINPPDGTQQASYCGTYYPMARDLLLEMHPWSFAVKRIAVAEVDNPFDGDWAYAYSIPSTCIRPLSALYPGVPAKQFGTDTDSASFPFIVETDEDGEPVLYTNVETAYLRYIDRVTDPNRFTPGFANALARLLASYLAGPVLKGSTGIQVAQAQWKQFLVEFARATAVNANIGKRDGYENFTPSMLRGRVRTGIPDGFVIE